VFTSNSLGFIFVCFVLPNLRFISVGENEGGEREREIRKSGDNTYLTTVEIWDLFIVP
jgi:hypothetical protein